MKPPESTEGGLTKRSRRVIEDGADKRNEVNLLKQPKAMKHLKRAIGA